MVQSAEECHWKNAPDGLDGTRYRRVKEPMGQMPLAKHNLFNTFPSDRADQPLVTSILPRRLWRGCPAIPG